MSEHRTALVTGGNRGMGFETCRQLAKLGYRVVMTCRDRNKGEKALQLLQGAGLSVHFHRLDVDSDEDIALLLQWLEDHGGRCDVLVNNAGILTDGGGLSGGDAASVFRTDRATLRQHLETNTLSPLMLSLAVLPLMRRHGYGRIVNVSSGMGQLSDMGGHFPGYRISKTALNAATRILAAEISEPNIKVNALCPGWVRTDMGGQNADRSIEQGVETTVWLATLPDDGPSGGYFRDKQAIDW
jgi:NAD(P)-dependent dehydrogenase (short-subunit alcohol dehydrogenase family)